MDKLNYVDTLLSYEQCFTEEYIGKIPEFQRTSELFDAMLKKAKKSPDTMNPNKWEENKEIRKIFKKFFGLKAFHLYWVPSDVRNAFTITDSALMGGERIDGVIDRKQGQGFYDTKHKCVFVIFGYCGILRPEVGFTGAELTAIFLHEIGHNFDHSIYTHLGIMRKLYLKLKKTDATTEHNKYKEDFYKNYKKYGNYIYSDQETRDNDREEDTKRLKQYMNCPALLKFIGGTFIGIVNSWYIMSGAYVLVQMIILGRRKGEQFADSFSTTYGFGPELMSGLLKLSDYSSLIVKNRRSDILMRDYADAQQEITALMFDEHASDQARCKDCIIKLKTDLKKKDYPEDMKRDLMEEIVSLEEAYDAIVNCSPEQRFSFVRGWRKFSEIIFKGRPELTKLFGRNQM